MSWKENVNDVFRLDNANSLNPPTLHARRQGNAFILYHADAHTLGRRRMKPPSPAHLTVTSKSSLWPQKVASSASSSWTCRRWQAACWAMSESVTPRDARGTLGGVFHSWTPRIMRKYPRRALFTANKASECVCSSILASRYFRNFSTWHKGQRKIVPCASEIRVTGTYLFGQCSTKAR